MNEFNTRKKTIASKHDEYGDTVVACSVCGRIAIGETGEDYSETVCVDCGNNEWKTLPFAKGANVRQNPNDAEVAQAGLRKRRVGASKKVQASSIRNAVFIDGNRDGYGPEQMENRTITVGEFIEHLQDFDEDAKVFIRNDNGYTYGKVSYSSVYGGRYNDGKIILDGADDEFDDEDDEDDEE